LDAFIQKNNPVMVCGPVIYESNGSFIENYQKLDGLSLQTVTMGSFGFNNPFLSNGANLAYSKNAFLKVNGFVGNDHIASGDDIFLMEKMKKLFLEQVKFLKSENAIVSTKPQKNWKAIINQRVRWASKTSKQKNIASLVLGFLVLLVNISCIALPFLMYFNSEYFIFYLALLCFKIIVDYLVIQQAGFFFKVRFSFLNFIWQSFIYSVITLLVIAGSLRGKYTWKGRIQN
jgi:cellulose synthase/poly-beta-1,6-N-acetylglucosamine synthase-like glycosyltransferase